MQKTKPFFSIITCTKNSEMFLQENIDSVESQTFKDYEHLFIDGYSCDSTLKKLRKYKDKFPNIVRIFKAKPKGMVNAMNIGIKKAKGKYVIHLNSDDAFINKSVLKRVTGVFKSNKVDWFFGAIMVVKDDRVVGTFPRKWYNIFFNTVTLCYYNFVPHQSTFLKRDLFKKFGYFDENIPHLSEYDYWLRISRKTRWSFINIPISKYRRWNGSSSYNIKNLEAIRISRNNIQKRHLSKFDILFSKPINCAIDFYSNHFILKRN